MAARPSWQGHLRLLLVACPVALYPATSEADRVGYNLINPETNNRINIDAGTGDWFLAIANPLAGSDQETSYVLLDKEDFKLVKLESTRTPTSSPSQTRRVCSPAPRSPSVAEMMGGNGCDLRANLWENRPGTGVGRHSVNPCGTGPRYAGPSSGT